MNVAGGCAAVRQVIGFPVRLPPFELRAEVLEREDESSFPLKNRQRKTFGADLNTRQAGGRGGRVSYRSSALPSSGWRWRSVRVVALLINFSFRRLYPVESMVPLNVNDRVLVASSAHLTATSAGDIVEKRYAPGSITDFINVAALPGETIAFVDGDVFIDGQLLNELYLNGATPGLGGTERAAPTRRPPTVCAGRRLVFRARRTDNHRQPLLRSDREVIVGRAFFEVCCWATSGSCRPSCVLAVVADRRAESPLRSRRVRRVHEIAVDGVDAHVDETGDLLLVLGVPAETHRRWKSVVSPPVQYC